MSDTYYRVSASHTDIYVQELQVLRKTPRGVWLDMPFGCPARFVLADARKRYAWPTLAEAVDSFVARKRRHLKILRAQARTVEALLTAATERRDALMADKYLRADRPLGLLERINA